MFITKRRENQKKSDANARRFMKVLRLLTRVLYATLCLSPFPPVGVVLTELAWKNTSPGIKRCTFETSLRESRHYHPAHKNRRCNNNNSSEAYSRFLASLCYKAKLLWECHMRDKIVFLKIVLKCE